jgi:hypothetical protein
MQYTVHSTRYCGGAWNCDALCRWHDPGPGGAQRCATHNTAERVCGMQYRTLSPRTSPSAAVMNPDVLTQPTRPRDMSAPASARRVASQHVTPCHVQYCCCWGSCSDEKSHLTPPAGKIHRSPRAARQIRASLTHSNSPQRTARIQQQQMRGERTALVQVRQGQNVAHLAGIAAGLHLMAYGQPVPSTLLIHHTEDMSSIARCTDCSDAEKKGSQATSARDADDADW